MKHIRTLAAAGALLAASSGAHSYAIIDFVKLTQGAGQLGESAWKPLTIDESLGEGFILNIHGDNPDTAPIGDAWAYLDWNHAGLGVCDELTSNSGDTARPGNGGNICNPGSDDNTTLSEQLVLIFNTAVTIDKIWLNNTHDDDRQIITPETVLINGDSVVVPGNGYATGNNYNNQDNLHASEANYIGGYSVNAGQMFTIGYGGAMPEQFYVSGLKVTRVGDPSGDQPPPPPIPLPGTLLLLGAGLLGLGATRRRQR